MLRKIILFATICLVSSCKTVHKTYDSSISDRNASALTQKFYRNLSDLKEKGYMVGHQDDLAYGANWRYQEGRSDIKDVVGDYPAVQGWDLAGLESRSNDNIDGVPFEKIKNWIKQTYQQGGVTTISWHMNNPLTGKNAWDTAPNSFETILPNGSKHSLYLSWLDNGAKFLNSLKASNGEKIPLLFRPFHELTGNWFWWCKNNATPEQFKEGWRMTIDYLRNKKGLHNLIVVYNSADFRTKEEFLEYYPGDDYVDIISYDKYQATDPTKDDTYITTSQNQLKIMSEIAIEHHKIMAIAETGYEAVPYANWWTKTLAPAIGDYKISYVLLWRNHGWMENEKKMHYYAPYKGQTSEKDFVEFYNMPKTLFLKDVAKENLYK